MLNAELMVNYELWIVSCLFTSRHRRLPTARPTAYCRLPTAYSFKGGGTERALGRHGSPRQDVTADRERKN
jgi:hypothetical protein